MDTATDRAALWEEYSRTREQRTREELILAYAPLVNSAVASVVRRLPAVLDMQDLVATGTIGLIQAIDRFEPGRGIKFETFAYSRIRGAVVDELRRVDWVSRGARSRLRTLEETRAVLGHALGRSPSQLELHETLDPTDAKFAGTTGVEATYVVSLDQLMSGGDSDDELPAIGDLLEDQSAASPDDYVQRQALLDALVAAIGQLRDRDSEVIALHYQGGLSQPEIARRLGLSESRVCQLHARAIGNLRIHLRNWAPATAGTRLTVETRHAAATMAPEAVASGNEALRLIWRSALRSAA